MKLMNRVLVSGLLLAVSVSASAANDTNIQYKNDHGSILNLTMNPDGKDTGTLTGTFTTAIGNCAAAIGKTAPVTGFYNGRSMAITMNFPGCKQVVAMKGHFIKNKEVLNTLWLGVNTAKETVEPQWDSTIVGHDHFVRTSKHA
jgi:hypothetical protein